MRLTAPISFSNSEQVVSIGPIMDSIAADLRFLYFGLNSSSGNFVEVQASTSRNPGVVVSDVDGGHQLLGQDDSGLLRIQVGTAFPSSFLFLPIDFGGVAGMYVNIRVILSSGTVFGWVGIGT